MNTAQATAAYALQAFTSLFNAATLTIYSGTQPASPETALSGNTALCAFTLATPPFGSASFSSGFESQTASFVSSSVTPSNNGTATFARVVINSTAWAINHAYSLGAIVNNGGNVYICVGAGTSAGSGGPTTTAQGIQDNTAVWNYVCSNTSPNNTLCDLTVGTSGTDVIIGSTSISTSVNVSITSAKIQLPAV